MPSPNCKTGAGIEPRGSLLLIPLGAFTVVEISGYNKLLLLLLCYCYATTKLLNYLSSIGSLRRRRRL